MCESELAPTSSDEPIWPTDPPRNENVWVVVQFLLDESGRPGEPTVVDSSNVLFEKSAVNAVLEWRYTERRTSCIHEVRIEYTWPNDDDKD